jgi:hypothetical protein
VQQGSWKRRRTKQQGSEFEDERHIDIKNKYLANPVTVSIVEMVPVLVLSAEVVPVRICVRPSKRQQRFKTKPWLQETNEAQTLGLEVSS